MLETLQFVGRQFDLPEDWDEGTEDAPVVELHSGYRIYYSPKSARLSYEETGTERIFSELAKEWREATRLSSSLTDMFLHPAYQRIIGMGPKAVPMILRDLQFTPAHWFWALSAITGEDPVNPEDAGRLKKMTEAWLDWGRERGYI